MNEDQNHLYNSDAEIESLVARFESFHLRPDELNHQAHVAITAWYYLKLPEPEAIERIYDGLQRFIRHYDIKVYNETITLFWMKRIRSFIAASDITRPAFEIVNDAVKALGNSQMIFDYYTKEQLESDDARIEWAEPDLKRLDF